MKRTWLLAVGAGVVVAVLGAGAVFAQSSGTPATGSDFLDRVAQKLGIDSPRLKQAIDDTRNEDIDAAVVNGDLTQKQADALKPRGESGPEIFGAKGVGPGMHGRGPGFDFGFGPGSGMGMDDAGQKFADFLGISTDQLKTELQADNATIASVAEAHGKSRDDVKAFITGNIKTRLDEAVANQDLTQKRADEMLSNINTSLDKLLDSHGLGHIAGKFKFHMRGGHGDGPDDNDGDNGTPPSDTPAPQSGSMDNGGFEF
jgi:hypothetical protein